MAHSSPDRAAKTGEVERRVEGRGGKSEPATEIGRNEGVGAGRLGVNPFLLFMLTPKFSDFVRSSFKSFNL